jgi:rRNA maturation protein Nop10
MPITLPCRACGKPVVLPVDDGPLVCEACKERTPVIWFNAPDPFGRYRLWLLKTGRIGREGATA